MYLTWLDNNAWLWEINSKRILVDPWLVGKLVFLKAPFFFEGVNPTPHPIPDNVDLILLSQGLPDHAHPETLSQIDRHIPVACSPNAADVVNNLGYEHVTVMPHGNVFTLDNAVEIRAVPGAAIGPFLTENGYILTDLASGLTLYYEPHGFPSDALDAFAPIDVVITPVVDISVPVAGPLLQGHKTVIPIAERLRPQVMLPTAEGGNTDYQGMLASVLKYQGSKSETRSQLEQAPLSTRFLTPRPGDRTEIVLTPHRASASNPNS